MKVILTTNIPAPYRIPLFNSLAQYFPDFMVVFDQRFGPGHERQVNESIFKFKFIYLHGFTIPYLYKVDRNAGETRVVNFYLFLLSFLIKHKPDCVISGEMGFRTLSATIYAKMFQRKILVWWEGTENSEQSVDVVRRLIRKILVKFIDGWITFGHSASRYVQSLGVSSDRIMVVGSCVDNKYFYDMGNKKREQVNAQSSQVRFLFVGRLVSLKGVSNMLMAFKKIFSEGITDWHLDIVGDGPEMANLRALVVDLESRGNILFLGGKQQDELAYYYANSDLLVMPTLRDVWGLVINEAMASGLPVIASKYAGATEELIQDAVNGLIIDAYAV
jgi:glycosyltransferase involved in cell wall biosynthesis